MNDSKKRLMVKDTVRYASANYIAQGLGVFNSVALRRFMGPTAMGVWSILQVILGYCGYASFGTTKALARDYPYLRGKGNHQKAEELKDMTLTFSMLMSLIPAGIISIYLFLNWNRLNRQLQVGLVFITLFLFVQRFYDLLMTLLRSDKKFVILGQLNVLNALGTLAVSVLLVSSWNIYGLFTGTALVTFGCLFFISGKGLYRFHFFWDANALWKELKLGIPLLASSFLAEFLKSIDKLIIAKKLGFYEVGLYSIAMMANSYVFSLPMMFAHVWYPNLQEDYGRAGNALAIKNYLLKPALILSVLCPFLCAMAIFGIPLVGHLFLPKFLPGMPAMKIYLVGTSFVLLAQFGGNFLVTLDKYLINIPILIAAALLNLILNLLFVEMGRGLTGVATGTAISLFFYGISSYTVALSHFMDTKDVISNVGKLISIFLSLFGIIFLIDRFLKIGNFYQQALAQITTFTLLSAPFCYVLQKKVGLFTHLREALFSKAQT